MTCPWNRNMWLFHKTPTRIHKIPFLSRSHTCPLQIHQVQSDSHLKTRHQITETKSHLSKHVSAKWGLPMSTVTPQFDGIWLSWTWFSINGFTIYRYHKFKAHPLRPHIKNGLPGAVSGVAAPPWSAALRVGWLWSRGWSASTGPERCFFQGTFHIVP